jgi:hypothetical protein
LFPLIVSRKPAVSVFGNDENKFDEDDSPHSPLHKKTGDGAHLEYEGKPVTGKFARLFDSAIVVRKSKIVIRSVLKNGIDLFYSTQNYG